MYRHLPIATALAIAALACACGKTDDVTPPAAPTGLQAAPSNGAAALTWSASPGATAYAVYYASSLPVTTASAKVAAAGTSTTVPALANGSPYWFAVTAVNSAGESPLSPGACAVPTAADQTGLTLLDGLCGTTLDGAKFWTPGLASARVAGGAAELSAAMDGMEAFSANGAQYNSSLTVAAAGARVTTLRSTITVPAASVMLDGTGVQVRAVARLVYSPPTTRLTFPKGSQDLLLFEVGLIDAGAGLKAFRQVVHCDDASCATSTSTGIAFDDPAGWMDGPVGAPTAKVADAAHDTAYVVEVALDESAGVFHWTIAGGTFGAGVGGTADPSGFLTGPYAPATWSGIPLAGEGFFSAQLGVRARDGSLTGGGSGKVTARFDDVHIAFDGAAAAAFDDFSGTGENSGPTLLSNAKWFPGGARSISAPGGALAMTLESKSTGTQVGFSQSIAIANPLSANTLQADLRIASSSTEAETMSYANATVRGRFYSDGSQATAGNALGDVVANVQLRAKYGDAYYSVLRCTTATCGATAVVTGGVLSGVAVGPGVHTVLLKWDPAAERFTFGVDGTTQVVDPTAGASGAVVAGPANAPMRDIMVGVGVPATVGSAASVDVRVNNVFTAP